MRLEIDEYAELDSPFHRWDARFKLVGLLVLIFAFSYICDLRLLLAMLALTALMYTVSGLPARFIGRWLRVPSLIILVIVLILPFVSGTEVLWSLGPLSLREEGLLAAFQIAVRFACIVTAGITLLGTTPLLTSLKAMRALGLPLIMADMALLSFRYLNELGEHLSRMMTAMKLRGFRHRRLSPGGLKTFAWLSGSLLVRSYERSEGVYRAMIVRGYGQALPVNAEFHSRPSDIVLLVVIITTAAVLVSADVLLGHNIAAILN
ncbi:MAG: cobalt ECF transporter T component CbiQ [Dehalococcoidia bacterium]|jgi:cobalt/nickel transport system permease protein